MAVFISSVAFKAVSSFSNMNPNTEILSQESTLQIYYCSDILLQGWEFGNYVQRSERTESGRLIVDQSVRNEIESREEKIR
jgi:hypothetical protein